MPLFSVIINNYNYDRYVGAAIESIEGQDHRDYELIVVDDGSSDGSIEVIGRHRGLRLLCTDRLGQARACLHALSHATGSFVYILDADDLAEPGLLRRAAEVASPGVSKIQFQLEPIDAAGTRTGAPFPRYSPDYGSARIRDEIRRTGFYVTPQTSGNILAKRVYDLIDDIDYEGAIDGVPLLVAPFVGEVVSLGEPLARYRLHGANESRAVSAARFEKERARFLARLAHLEAVLAGLGMALDLVRPPDAMFLHADSIALEHLRAHGRLTPAALEGFLRAMRRESGPARRLKLTAWALLAAYGPGRVRSLMLQLRANPWSPLRSPAEFAAALLRGPEAL